MKHIITYFTSWYAGYASPAVLVKYGHRISYTSRVVAVSMLVFSLISSFYFAYHIVPRFAGYIERDVVEHIPDFRATLADGILAVDDLEQPFEVVLSNDLLLIIDTVSTSSVFADMFADRDGSGIAIFRDRAVSFARGEHVSDSFTYSEDFYPRTDEFVVTRENILSFSSRLQGSLRSQVFAITLPILFALWSIFVLLYFAFLTFVVWATQRIVYRHRAREDRHSWKELYSMSLILFSFPQAITFVFIFFGIPVAYIVTIAVLIGLARVVAHPRPSVEHKNSSESVNS